VHQSWFYLQDYTKTRKISKILEILNNIFKPTMFQKFQE